MFEDSFLRILRSFGYILLIVSFLIFSWCCVQISVCVLCVFCLRVDCADILLVDCSHGMHVTRSARDGRFAPAGLASRARDHVFTF